MPRTIGPRPSSIEPGLLEKAARTSFPTFGHHLEAGFVESGIARVAGDRTVVGRALTVQLTAEDSTMLYYAAGLCEPGDVIVIDMVGDRRHAPVGAVLAAALAARGAAGVVVDGVVTDIEEIRATGLPVYARGLSVLTTKLLELDAGSVNAPIVIGGVPVLPGDLVLGDANGLFIAPPATVAELVDTVLTEDGEEPAFIAQVLAGASLGELTGITERIDAAVNGAAR